MAGKKTVVLGASPNPARYSYLATRMLLEYGHEVVALGHKPGRIDGQEILEEWPGSIPGLDTITMYMNATRQHQFEDYLLSLQPKRIIFNPGAENPSLATKARAQGIQTMDACTLVLLRTGQY